MEKLFQILAVVFIGLAAFFLWRADYDGMFIAATVGAVCFFLSYRFQVGERVKQRAAAKQTAVENAELTGGALTEEEFIRKETATVEREL